MISLPQPQTLQGLRVRSVTDLSPSLRRVELSGEALVGMAWAPGQDLMLRLPRRDGSVVSRRYTIRRADGHEGFVELNVVLHGDGPAARWAQAVQAGQGLDDVVGPRGKISLHPDQDWHLFLGDDTYLPATLAMLEALPQGAQGLAALEVGAPEDEQPLRSEAEATITWLHRGSDSPGDPGRLLRWLEGARLPPGAGHVYVAGEVRLALAIRDRLLTLGLKRERVSAKGYWIKGRANADRGEPDESS
ncbi:MAG: siderophore-interacting protein [Candidatus Dormibacteria bacterium]